MTSRVSIAGVLISMGLVIAAMVIGYDAFSMRVPPIHAKVGPRVFPIIVSCALAVAGAFLLWRAGTGRFAEEEAETDWGAVGIMAAGLVLHMNLLRPAGFIISGIVLFLSVTLAFGSQRYMRDAIVAVLVVTAAYMGFTKFLGLQLPAGLLGWAT
jgi:putative tricarboxylic transport membrane protein